MVEKILRSEEALVKQKNHLEYTLHLRLSFKKNRLFNFNI